MLNSSVAIKSFQKITLKLVNSSIQSRVFSLFSFSQISNISVKQTKNLFKVKPVHHKLLLGYNNIQLSTMSDSEDKKTELKKRLTPLQYHVTQEKGTERAFSGKLNKCYDSGTYSCVVCDQPLFSSDTKFDSGCGWPAFNDVLEQGRVKLTKDTSHGMVRTEVTCVQCNAHLGHVFGDGPAPTKRRFCINSASLQFHPDNPEKPST